MPILYNPAPVASSTVSGYMTSADKSKLDGIASEANKYILPTAASSTLGGISVGYTTSNQNYAVQVDSNGNAYVSVPWTDTVYTHPTTSGNKHIPSGGSSGQWLQYSADGTAVWASLPTASTSAAGIVQLNNSYTSSSTTLAATANAVKSAYDTLNTNKASTSHTHKSIPRDTTLEWFNAPIGLSWYYYEGGNVTNSKLPTEHCVILVMRSSNNRGYAVGFSWPNGHHSDIYTTNVHFDVSGGTWSSWSTYHLQE